MQPQDFDVGDPQPRPLDDRHDLGQRRRIAAGEDVFAQPRVGRARPVHAADRMQQRDPVGRQQLVDLAEERRVLADPDMLEHADRDDAVVAAGFLAVIAQVKPHTVGQPGQLRRAAVATLCCSSDSVSPVTSAPHSVARYSASPPQPEPISSTFCPGRSSSLAAMCRFLFCCAVSRSSSGERK